MVKLFNIKRDGKYISAEFSQIGCDDKGFIKIDLIHGERVEYSKPPRNDANGACGYYAFKKLNEIKSQESIPEHLTIAFY